MKINGITSKLRFFAGHGEADIKMFRGNFDITDHTENMHEIFPEPEIQEENGRIRIAVKCEEPDCNRLVIQIPAEKEEHVIGGGEQFSYLDLRGRVFPIWTREQGVGRNKATEITQLADAADSSGGDYHTTFFPQCTFVSSQMYFFHLAGYDYSELDFTCEDCHKINIWNNQAVFYLYQADTYEDLLTELTALLGRQPELPEWAMKGIWLGVQGGTERTLELLNKCRDGGVEIPAVWIQDWEGKRVTSFGKRLQWDWRWNQEMYPRLDEVIASDEDTRWMAYINPYLVEGGVLFREAEEQGFFVKNREGRDYLFDFGEYDCGVVDLTMPEAFQWYKNVIKNNIIAMGFKGWMADFGEYLPADAVCFGGDGLKTHNAWPMLWAKCNREAITEAGMEGKCVFYMRAGAAESGRYSTLTWAGDQCVDWSVDDGLPSVITAALSLGMSGFGLHTSDCGGYTTLFHLKRTEELLERWLEFSCFTPIMRTHEGNRPDSNVQLYSNEKMISAAAKWSKIHTMLLPYMKECVRINAEKGIPVMRPLFFAEPENDRLYCRDLFTYMLGEDVIVAPVVEEAADTRRVLLPQGEWIHLWSGEEYAGGEYSISAPMGKPPVFFRKGSRFTDLFAEVSGEKY